MNTERIRPIAVCLFRHGNQILVSEGFDRVKQSYFYRPLGGEIEYGETAKDALLREIQEELDAELEYVQFIGVIENIFIYEGKQGHEIVFVFDAKFSDKSLYEQKEINGYRMEENLKFKAKWRSLNEIGENGGKLVPENLASLLFSDRRPTEVQRT